MKERIDDGGWNYLIIDDYYTEEIKEDLIRAGIKTDFEIEIAHTKIGATYRYFAKSKKIRLYIYRKFYGNYCDERTQYLVKSLMEHENIPEEQRETTINEYLRAISYSRDYERMKLRECQTEDLIYDLIYELRGRGIEINKKY